MMHVKNLSVHRNGKRIFSDLSFKVADGELLMITGKNGVGKSTLLHALAGVDVGEVSGEIADAQGSFLGLAAHERFARGVMLVFQEPPVLDGVSFVTLVREIRYAQTGIRPEIAQVYGDVRKISARVGIDEDFFERSLFKDFSGGEKKRMELALLALAQPKIALIDEIDAGLDTQTKKIAEEIINELLAQGSTVLCVTHDKHFLHSEGSSAKLQEICLI